jgi:hypothetical protein
MYSTNKKKVVLSLVADTYLKYNSGTIIEKAIYDIHSTLIRHNTEKQTQQFSYLC